MNTYPIRTDIISAGAIPLCYFLFCGFPYLHPLLSYFSLTNRVSGIQDSEIPSRDRQVSAMINWTLPWDPASIRHSGQGSTTFLQDRLSATRCAWGCYQGDGTCDGVGVKVPPTKTDENEGFTWDTLVRQSVSQIRSWLLKNLPSHVSVCLDFVFGSFFLWFWLDHRTLWLVIAAFFWV